MAQKSLSPGRRAFWGVACSSNCSGRPIAAFACWLFHPCGSGPESSSGRIGYSPRAVCFRQCHVSEFRAWQRYDRVDGARHIREVWHLAASTSFEASKRDETFRANVDGTRNLLDVARWRWDKLDVLYHMIPLIPAARGGVYSGGGVCVDRRIRERLRRVEVLLRSNRSFQWTARSNPPAQHYPGRLGNRRLRRRKPDDVWLCFRPAAGRHARLRRQ